MRIAIVTAYFNETFDQLKRCHDSVLAQSGGDVTHFMVSDGRPNTNIDNWNCVHIKLPNHGDYGDTPRAVGATSASALGFDAICFLDADNWLDDDHVSTLAAVAEEHDLDVVTVARRIVTKDFRVLGTCEESDGLNFTDTNCYFIRRPAFPACAAWAYKDPADGIVGDRRFWKAITEGDYSRAHVRKPTINYVSTLAFHYQMFNETPPEDSKVIVRVTGQKEYKMISYAEFLGHIKGNGPA
jgi:glycosyltransferase involved in cell wall biosynthesis